MKTIPLTQGYFTKVDDEDYEKFAIFRWQAGITRNNKNTIYVRPTRGLLIDGKWSKVQLARLIMNAPQGLYVDHINHDTLDNRKANLRLCSKAENAHNSRKQTNNTSGYKGVGRVSKNRWQAKIYFKSLWKKKLYNLGCFKTKEAAARAYDKAAIKYFGEFAFLNFPK